MKSRSLMTDEEVLAEVERLTNSPEVRLARKEQRLIYRARQYLSHAPQFGEAWERVDRKRHHQRQH